MNNMNVKVRRKYKVINGDKILHSESHYNKYGDEVCRILSDNNIELNWEYEYDCDGNKIKALNPYSNDIRYYDSKGNIILSENNNTQTSINYVYDGYGNLIYVKEGKTITLEHTHIYDSRGRLLYTTDKNGVYMYYGYDENYNITYKRDSNGYEWFYKYDDKGNLKYTKDIEGIETYYTYDENNKLMQIYMINDNKTWSYKRNEYGNVVYEKNFSGKEYYYEYEYYI